MLKYFISTTETLIAFAVLLGMLSAYISAAYGARGGRAVLVGSLTGLAAAVVMAYLKNKTKLIDTGAWNLYIFGASILLLILLCVFDAKWLRKKTGPAAGLTAPVITAALACDMLFYALPDVLAYPYTIVQSGSAVLSTAFIYRFIGVILGVALAVVAFLAVRRACQRLGGGAVGVLFKLAYAVLAVQQLTKIMQTLLTRRIISGHWIFTIVKFTSNHASLFTFGVLAVAVVVPVVLWLRSFHVNEPYENPAQHRKIRANWRSIRRWSSTVIVCFALSVLTMTTVKAYANRPVELSPTEECELRGDNIYIPFEQVDDGHLHRFAYTTDSNVAVRFIIIKKPNSSAYGIGLDACDICGETGYYERDGQVVCNRCDVVMNVNTIGFKGGCNPKVIDYSIENGYIIVPTYTLIEHESDFK